MRGNSQLIRRIRNQSPADLSIITITLAVTYYGIEESSVKKKARRSKIEAIRSQLALHPFNEQAAVCYGSIRASLEKLGLPISARDLQIAVIAMANRFWVVTNNTREFSRIPKLEVENWLS